MTKSDWSTPMRSKVNYYKTDKPWLLPPSMLPHGMGRATLLFRHSPSRQAGLDVDSDRTETLKSQTQGLLLGLPGYRRQC